MNKKTIIAGLKRYKKRKALSTENLACLIGINYSTLRRIITKKTKNPHLLTCERIEEFLSSTEESEGKKHKER